MPLVGRETEKLSSSSHSSLRTLPMAKAKCRSCDHAAYSGAHCNSCAAVIMANALNPFFSGRRKKFPRSLPTRTSNPVTQYWLSVTG